MTNLTKFKSNVKVYIGIPWLSNDDYDTFLGSCLNYIGLQETSVKVLPPKTTPPYSGKFKRGDSSILYAITDRMNAIVDDYLKTDATHLWIIDADVEVPPHALETLLRHDVDLASGVYPFHNFDFCKAMMFGRMHEENDCGFFIPRDWKYMRDYVMGINERVSGGTGCILIKRRVFGRYHPKVEALRFTKSDGKCGADVYFWKRAQDMGFTARVDPNVVCGHRPEWKLSEVERWGNLEF